MTPARRMFTLRCTAKLRKRLGTTEGAPPPPPSTKLGDWYADLPRIPRARKQSYQWQLNAFGSIGVPVVAVNTGMSGVTCKVGSRGGVRPSRGRVSTQRSALAVFDAPYSYRCRDRRPLPVETMGARRRGIDPSRRITHPGGQTSRRANDGA